MLRYSFPICLLPIFFTSCATVEVMRETAANAGKSVQKFSLADLRPSEIAVVEVREKEMKEMPLGKDRAMAFEKKRKRSFWSFNLPNFREPDLPEISDGDFEGSLLPPKPL